MSFLPIPWTLRTIKDPPGEPSFVIIPTNFGYRTTPVSRIDLSPPGRPISKYIRMFVRLPNQASVILNTATLERTATGGCLIFPNVVSSEVETSPVNPVPESLIVHV